MQCARTPGYDVRFCAAHADFTRTLHSNNYYDMGILHAYTIRTQKARTSESEVIHHQCSRRLVSDLPAELEKTPRKLQACVGAGFRKTSPYRARNLNRIPVDLVRVLSNSL